MRGFSLVEVLVALIIIVVGMLGIAKMHALALESTGSAGTRSLVAIETAGLASAMHADRDYWAATTTAAYNVNVTPTGVTNSISSSAPDCVASVCGNSDLAAYDLQQYGAALQQIVPAANANISCPQGGNPPLTCVITVNWVETLPGLTSATSSTAISSAATGSAPGAGGLQLPQYILYVDP